MCFFYVLGRLGKWTVISSINSALLEPSKIILNHMVMPNMCDTHLTRVRVCGSGPGTSSS